MNKVTRPSKIAASLKIIQAEFPTNISVELEAYIAALEAKQVLSYADSEETPIWDSTNPPNWSQKRAVEREQARKTRKLQKLNAFR